jgi:hypothetical protein
MNLDKVRDCDAVMALQREVAKLPQVELPTENFFHGGMLCRKVWRAAGVVIVGRVHKKEHFYLVASGTVLVTTDEGAKRITGPELILSKPGTKRAVYAETDAVCMTFHRTDALTVEDAEKELVEDDPMALLDAYNRPKVLT